MAKKCSFGCSYLLCIEVLNFTVVAVGALANLNHPTFQWPLCQLTNAFDTVNRIDAETPRVDECFALAQGPPLMVPLFYAFWFEPGTNSYATMPTTGPTSPTLYDSFSVSMYVYPDILEGVMLYYQANNLEAYRITSFYMGIQYGRLMVVFMNSSKKAIMSGKSSSALGINQWNLVVIIRDKSTEQLLVRVNDVSYRQSSADFKQIPVLSWLTKDTFRLTIASVTDDAIWLSFSPLIFHTGPSLRARDEKE